MGLHRVTLALEWVLAGLGLAWIVVFLRTGTAAVGTLLAWDAVAVAYMVAGWQFIRRELFPSRPRSLHGIVGPRWYTQFLAVLVSCAGLGAGLIVITHRGTGQVDQVAQAVAVATILVSWLLLHAMFAQIYTREYAGDGGLEFPNCPAPQFTEFVYFAVTIGTTFAVSDVDVTSRSMRRQVIVHSVISFFFNAALIAIAIDWFKS